MSDATHITITGNLTRDAELRFSLAGKPTCTFGLATNNQVFADGKWIDEDTSFFQVTVHGRMAERAADELRRGDRVIATGRLQIRQYRDSDDNPRQDAKVWASEIGLSLRHVDARFMRDIPPMPSVPDDIFSGGPE